jgi:hypothetical protein
VAGQLGGELLHPVPTPAGRVDVLGAVVAVCGLVLEVLVTALSEVDPAFNR